MRHFPSARKIGGNGVRQCSREQVQMKIVSGIETIDKNNQMH